MESTLRDKLFAHLDVYIKERADKALPVSAATRVSYGTAGFRGDAAQIEPIFHNVGLIAAVRALQAKANIGLMITASHNPVQDNGLKIIDPNGEMLELQWEPVVEDFCNTFEADVIKHKLEQLFARFKITPTTDQPAPYVLIGMDNRPSSEALAVLIKRALEPWSPFVQFVDHGLVTTPALHYLVAETNLRTTIQLGCKNYYNQLIAGLLEIFESPLSPPRSHYCATNLTVDCANGVGCETMKALLADERFHKVLPIKLINTCDGILNKTCGADYVKTTHLAPISAHDTAARYATLDGDADRVVYFYLESGDAAEQHLKLHILDGDKIAALFALYLRDLLKQYNLQDKLTLGAVQTAYANGASTEYLEKVLNLRVDCVDTGVKNLHRQALLYDLGVFFEANGHGTICLSQKARSFADQAPELKRLFAVLNNYTGDAISDILMVETILRHYDWSLEQWNNIYQDRPSSLTAIDVPDRSRIKTSNAGRTCVEPQGMQKEIDTIVATFGPSARCFVRPSGTENVVRIYAETEDQKSSHELARLVGERVQDICNNKSTVT